MHTHIHSLKTCGDLEVLTSTTICKKCGVKLALEGRNAKSRKPIWSSNTKEKITNVYINFCSVSL